MDKELFSIGEVAKIKDMTIKALRFYDSIGLLKPHHTDQFSRYRYYHISQFAYLDIIKAARGMDISPNDLIPYFKKKDSEGLVAFLDAHTDNVRRKIETLGNTLRSIEQVKNTLNTAKAAGKEEGVYIKNLQERQIITVPYDRSKTEEEFIIDYSKLDSAVSRLGLLSTYESGLLFTKDSSGEFQPGYLFTSVTGPAYHQADRTVPGGAYACVRYDRLTVERQQDKLQKYLLANGLTPTVLVQVTLLDDLFSEEQESCELQARIGD